jgi:hypothetical protein
MRLCRGGDVDLGGGLIMEDSPEISSGNVIEDVNVAIRLLHDVVDTLAIQLGHDMRNVVLWDGGCEGAGVVEIRAVFDDEALPGFRARLLAGRRPPYRPLEAFDGRDAFGTWRLSIVDSAADGHRAVVDEWAVVIRTTIEGPASADCDGNGVPDECEADADGRRNAGDHSFTGGAAQWGRPCGVRGRV